MATEASHNQQAKLELVPKKLTSTEFRRMYSGALRKRSRSTPSATKFLGRYLESGWESYFTFRRAGKSWGCLIVCPSCGAKPPNYLEYGYQRWRWMSSHVAVPHGKRVYTDALNLPPIQRLNGRKKSA